MKPSWTNSTETKRLLRRKQRWYQRAKSKYSSNARSTYLEIKKLAQRACRKAHLDYVRDLVTDDRGGKKLWTYIKGLQKDNTGISDLYSGNTLITNPEHKANMSNTFFTKVFSSQNSKPEEHALPTSPDIDPMFPIKVGRAQYKRK